jgi:hypothetical protein
VTYQTDDQTVTDVAENILAVGLTLSESNLEVIHGGETRDLTSSVTEDETTHRHDDTQDEGPPCEVLDRAVVDDAIVLLQSRVSPLRRSSLRVFLLLSLRLEKALEIAHTHIDG